LSEFSKLVRSRLKAQQAPAEHLDPGVLAAFAEHRLSEQERIVAVSHLATCANCREVVALASEIEPDLQGATPAKSVPIPHRRLSMWRVGMIGALAALAVSATVLLRMDRSRPAAATAKLQVEEPAAASPSLDAGKRKDSGQVASQVVPPAEPKKSEQRAEQGQSVRGHTSAAVDETLAANARPAQAHGAAGDLMALSRPKVVQPQTAPSAGYVPPVASPPQQPAPADDFAASDKNSYFQQQPSPQQQKATSQVAAASQTVEVQAASPSMQSMNAQLREAPVAKRSAAAEMQTFSTLSQWSITADGKLQRSTGAGPEGQQWQPVPVDSNVIFRVVNAAGRDVWAGGNRGALFHSTDGGDHWSRISPQSGNRKLEGDIISIRIAGGNSIVRLLTSAGHSWMSSDSGATWKVESR
jgi:hypothetical protein